MDKPKARILKELDGYTKLTIFVPDSFGRNMSTQFDPQLSNKNVRAQVQGIIDALHEALDEVEGND